jgi:hypothetical protein
VPLSFPLESDLEIVVLHLLQILNDAFFLRLGTSALGLAKIRPL